MRENRGPELPVASFQDTVVVLEPCTDPVKYFYYRQVRKFLWLPKHDSEKAESWLQCRKRIEKSYV